MIFLDLEKLSIFQLLPKDNAVHSDLPQIHIDTY